MSVLDYLSEELYDASHMKTPFYDGYVEVFHTPTSREMKDIGTTDNSTQGIRMGIDTNGDLYAWRSEALHAEISDQFGLQWLVRLLYVYPNDYVSLSGGTFKVLWDKVKDKALVDLVHAIPNLKEVRNAENEVIWSK